MSRLSEREYLTLLSGIERIHGSGDMASLTRAMVDVAASVVPAAHVTYNELDPERQRAICFFNIDQVTHLQDRYLPTFVRHMHEHPVLQHVRTAQQLAEAPGVRKISDFLPDADYHETALYRDVYRHLETRYQMIVPVMNGAVTVGLALNRDRADFSERDREVLALLAPHLAIAYRAARQRERVAWLFDPACIDAATEFLRELRLTQRQAQVLFWCIQGKTSPEIAVILASKPRTIHKHLENIFARLGVGTRAAAISRVIEFAIRQ